MKSSRREYINAYIDLHKKARLGVADDKRKQQLMKDLRLEKLKRLRSLPLLDAKHLERWIDRVGSLRSCFALTEKDLESKPRCPHCSFNPGQDIIFFFRVLNHRHELEECHSRHGGTIGLIQYLKPA